jgi:DNA-binding Xre family transcriptional regulator
MPRVSDGYDPSGKVVRMVWSSRDDSDPAILRGRAILGAAVRRARLRRGLSQRQLGWAVGFDQTTISRLETAKLKGMRFRMLVRLIGMLGAGDEWTVLDGPPPPSRRLPGQRDAEVSSR